MSRIALAAALIFAAMPAAAARKALVIGNGAYQEGALKNPVSDATAVADKLRGLGFQVTLLTDATLRNLQTGISKFANSLHAGDESFVFYAGHGVQIKGENFLLPVDFKADTEADAEFAAYRIEQLFGNLEDKRLGVSVVVLDACRDNPFRTTRSGSRGLRIVSSGAGTVVAFATSPGKTAMDAGSDGHSVFTAALLEHLGDPVDVEEMLRKVRLQVAARTGQAQVPWTSAGLSQGYFLAGEPSRAQPTPGPAVVASLQPPRRAAARTERLLVLEFENKLKKSKTEPTLDRYYFSDVVRMESLKLRPGLSVMSRENLLSLLEASGKSPGEMSSELEIGRTVMANFVISGDLRRVGASYRIGIRLLDTNTGALLGAAEAKSDTVEQLDDSLKTAVAELFRAVH